MPAGPASVRERVILANHERANNPVLLSRDATIVAGHFESQFELPKSLPWSQVVIRATVDQPHVNGLGVATVKLIAPIHDNK